MRGEVTREGAAAEQKSVVLAGAGAECGHETRHETGVTSCTD